MLIHKKLKCDLRWNKNSPDSELRDKENRVEEGVGRKEIAKYIQKD